MRNHNNDAMTAEGRAEGQKEASRLIAKSLDRASTAANLPMGFPITWESNISFIICVKFKVTYNETF